MRDNYVEIDLFDLCRDILKKWKIVVACVLICALLGGLYAVFQTKKAKPDEATTIKELTASLTQEEKDNVEDAARIIESYREMYAKQKEYNDNSIYQNLNPYDLKTIKLSYYVDNHYKVSYPVIEENNNLIPIITMYTADYAKEDFYADFSKERGIGNPAYVKELITTIASDKDSGVFSIIVYADTDENLEAIGEFVKQAVSDKQAEVTELYGEHDITLISETVCTNVNTLMADTQQLNIERLTTIASDIANEEKLFSGSQLSYLQYLIHEQKPDQTSRMKFLMTGAVVGALIAVLFVFIKYVTDGTLKTEREISRYLEMSVLGKTENGSDYIAAKINSAAESGNYKKVAFLCDENDSFAEKVISLIKPEAVAVTGVLSDTEAFEKLNACDAAVLFEKIKMSKRRDVVDKKQICKNADIKLLGVILK